MSQQTLELSGDCRKLENILKNKDASKDIKLIYEGNSRMRFKHHAKRKYNKKGYPLTHAQEIYSRDLSEKRAYNALNELVRQKKVEIGSYEGLFWYSWV